MRSQKGGRGKKGPLSLPTTRPGATSVRNLSPAARWTARLLCLSEDHSRCQLNSSLPIVCRPERVASARSTQAIRCLVSNGFVR